MAGWANGRCAGEAVIGSRVKLCAAPGSTTTTRAASGRSRTRAKRPTAARVTTPGSSQTKNLGNRKCGATSQAPETDQGDSSPDEPCFPPVPPGPDSSDDTGELRRRRGSGCARGARARGRTGRSSRKAACSTAPSLASARDTRMSRTGRPRPRSVRGRREVLSARDPRDVSDHHNAEHVKVSGDPDCHDQAAVPTSLPRPVRSRRSSSSEEPTAQRQRSE